MDGLLVALFMAVVVAVTVLASPRTLRAIRDWRTRRRFGPTRQEREERAERMASYKAEFEAANPEGPPISDEEHAAFAAWLDAQHRPALRLTPAPDTPVGPDGTRLGGPAWLAEGQDWPKSNKGNPLEFIAQLDFAELPRLAGFPESGVLQFFTPNDDDVWGANFDDPPAGEMRILFRQNGTGEHRTESPRPTEPMDDFTPFTGKVGLERGIALTATPFVDRISLGHWQVDERFQGNHRRPGAQEWEDMLIEQTEAAPLAHHVGGYPCFVQSDFRERGKYGDYDICLLRLTSDDYLEWGDIGEANFLIRAADLEARDFSKAIFWWDCS